MLVGKRESSVNMLMFYLVGVLLSRIRCILIKLRYSGPILYISTERSPDCDLAQDTSSAETRETVPIKRKDPATNLYE